MVSSKSLSTEPEQEKGQVVFKSSYISELKQVSQTIQKPTSSTNNIQNINISEHAPVSVSVSAQLNQNSSFFELETDKSSEQCEIFELDLDPTEVDGHGKQEHPLGGPFTVEVCAVHPQ